MDFKTMLQLPVLEISQVLKTLQGIADEERNKEKPQMPNVSIGTSRGNVSGYFINYDTEKSIVLLGNWYDHKPDLQYVELHAIASISLGNIENFQMVTFLLRQIQTMYQPYFNLKRQLGM